MSSRSDAVTCLHGGKEGGTETDKTHPFCVHMFSLNNGTQLSPDVQVCPVCGPQGGRVWQLLLLEGMDSSSAELRT